MRDLFRLWEEAALILVLLPFFFGSVVQAQESEVLEVESAVICRGIEDREAIDAGTDFAASVEKLYCLTKINGSDHPVEVIHIWYYGDTERARINLPVKFSPWRTYSSKIIQPHEIGQWHVDIVDTYENILKTIHFSILP